MRLMMTIGGLTGFLVGIVLGLAQHGEWPSILWRASVAAYVGGLLLRWWGSVWLRSLREAHRARLDAERAAPPANPVRPARV